MEKKQIAIIGAGIAGLVACKYCISKGFEPIVFEFESHIGGVWAKTLKDTRLQIPKTMYQFSDYPWPASVTDDMPTQQETIDYIHSYAKHFQLMPHINFCSRVKGISYDGPSSDSWVLWNGTGEPFPPQGKWNITVENTKTATTQVYTVDFVILCIGRYKDVPNMPKFPQGKGLDVFQGKAIHSLQYATLDNDAAEQLVKGKNVIVIGLGKSELDIARSCAEINVAFAVLVVHKPEQGYLLKVLLHISFTREQGLAKTCLWCLMHIPDPDNFFDRLKKGSNQVKKLQAYNMENGFVNEAQDEQRTKENKNKDSKALFFIQKEMHDSIFSRIAAAETSKEAWEILQNEFKGSTKVITVKLQTLRHKFLEFKHEKFGIFLRLSLKSFHPC
ncbi:N-oxide-forming dimethylaniline monooxygenase [Tanacetum coccineum]